MPHRRYFAWRPHPWHGLPVGEDPPRLVNAFIEITPFDLVKYEIHKPTGYLRVDRPQRTSSTPPMLYGFVPRTHCGPRVAALCPDAPRADDDPLDICVLSERPINRSEILLEATVVGGLQMIDGDEADDKLVAVLATDPVWAGCTDIAELPRTLVDRLAHYFTTYKLEPGQPPRSVIRSIYGHEHAFEVVTAAAADYLQAFGTPAPSPPPAW